MGFEYILFKKEDDVARLTLNHPPHNVLNIAMMREIATILEELDDDPAIKVLVIDAAVESKAFSAGVDISEHTADQVDEMIAVFHRLFHLFELSEVPSLAVVNGAALGGGCELILHCDVVIASEISSFGQPEIQVGVFPPVAAISLPEIVGPKKAFEMVITGDRIRAEEALRTGLVNKVVPQEELGETAEEFVAKLTKLSGIVLRMTKQAMRLGRTHRGSFADGLDVVEQLYLGPLMATEDATEGLNAFIEKRPPEWKNR